MSWWGAAASGRHRRWPAASSAASATCFSSFYQRLLLLSSTTCFVFLGVATLESFLGGECFGYHEAAVTTGQFNRHSKLHWAENVQNADGCVLAAGVGNNRKWTVIGHIGNQPIRTAPVSPDINYQWVANFAIQDEVGVWELTTLANSYFNIKLKN